MKVVIALHTDLTFIQFTLVCCTECFKGPTLIIAFTVSRWPHLAPP